MIHIYSLSDPFTGEIKYVGKTNGSLTRRINQHLCSQNLQNKSHTIYWLKQLKSNNARPIIEDLEICSLDVWQEREIYWIEQCRQWGFKLTNTTIGGDVGCLGYKHTEEAKKRIGILNSRPKSKEWIENAAIAMRKRVAKEVYQYDFDGKLIKIWSSLFEICNFLGDETLSKRKNISACCYGKRRSAYGFIWKYENTELKDKEPLS